MNNIPIITTSQNIEGNIGSCHVVTTQYMANTFKRENMQVNSCTGEIVGSNQYVDLSFYFSIIIFVCMLFTVYFLFIKEQNDFV